ncbi:MAG TPA: sigma factor-like helix-turn-helix DNA-binding protein, partial [Methylomirabilota bacterium]|nr:sigma factor-like helix-turn-helix DNA-binding protein [Methylomirabilota bacterium]
TWAQIEPLLDDALDKLGEADRAAILLRFFENKSLREVGLALGVNQDSAQKRVTRAVERLRKWFAGQGVVLSASAFTSWPEHVVQSAPQAVGDTVIQSAFSTSTLSVTTTSLVKGTMKTIAWMKMKMAATWLVALLLAGGTTVIIAQKTGRGDEADRSTPVGALRYLADAYRTFDGDRVADAFDTNSVARQQVVLAMAGAVSAEGRLRRTMAAKFNDPSATNQRPAFMMSFGQQRLDEAEAEVQDEHATVTIPGRKEPLQLTRSNGIWRITEAAAKGDERTIQGMNAAARVAIELNGEVQQGKYQSTSEVMGALRQKMMRAIQP